MPLVKKCLICQSQFKTKPYFVKKGGGKYCSRPCKALGSRTGKVVSCFHCGVEVYKSGRYIKKGVNNFCSKSCQTKWRNTFFVGKKHANWKGGKHAYRRIMDQSDAKKQCLLCKTEDRRILAVHHLDENRLNNKVENLVYLCHNCHHLVHHYKDARDAFKNMVAMV